MQDMLEYPNRMEGSASTPRSMLFDSCFLRGLQLEISSACGAHAESVLQACGSDYGQRCAERLQSDWMAQRKRPIDELSIAEFTSLLAESLSSQGWGRVEIDYALQLDGVLTLRVENPPFAEIVGRSLLASESVLAGILAGFFSFFAEERLGAVQTECVTRGASAARFVVTGASRLVELSSGLAADPSHDDIIESLCQPDAGPEETLSSRGSTA